MHPHTPVRAAILLGCALLVSVLLPREAAATKDYARKEEKDCSWCHLHEKGSGPRNERGREYEANGYRFGVESWSTDANRDKYLRANAAYLATWYGEALRLLDELEKDEELPGGKALVAGRRDRMKMFPKAWLRAAKGLLDKAERGIPDAAANAMDRFLVRLESQFPATDEGREAVRLLDDLVKKHPDEVTTARAREKVRLRLLEARLELGLGRRERGRELLAEVLADPLGAAFSDDVKEILAAEDDRGR